MATMDMKTWRTGIAEVVSSESEEEVIVRGRKLSELTGTVSFAEMMYLMFTGDLPTKPQARVLDALLVSSVEHGIAPPSMIARCFASYGTTIQAAVGGGILAFGDQMGGLGEQLAKLMSERIKSNQIQRLAREEREMLTQQGNTLSTQVEAQNQVVRKLEEKERVLHSNLVAMDKVIKIVMIKAEVYI